jgi:hypothetical protein
LLHKLHQRCWQIPEIVGNEVSPPPLHDNLFCCLTPFHSFCLQRVCCCSLLRALLLKRFRFVIYWWQMLSGLLSRTFDFSISKFPKFPILTHPAQSIGSVLPGGNKMWVVKTEIWLMQGIPLP